MKTRREFDAIISKDSEGFYVATVPALRGCHTQAKSMDELVERLKEVVELCLEDEDSGLEKSEFIGIQKVFI